MPPDHYEVTDLIAKWRLSFNASGFASAKGDVDMLLEDLEHVPEGKLRFWFEDWSDQLPANGPRPQWARFKRYIKGRARRREHPPEVSGYERSRWAKHDAALGVDDGPPELPLPIQHPRVGETLARMRAKLGEYMAGHHLRRRGADRGQARTVPRDDPGQRERLLQQALELSQEVDVADGEIPF